MTMDLYRRRRIDAHIDMTPMIDTLLQLFMIFLLSASFVASSVQIDLPRASAQHPDPGERIAVAIDGDEKLFLNNAPVSRDTLHDTLHAACEIDKDLSILLRADRDLAYQKVVETLVDIQASGAAHVCLVYDWNPRDQKTRSQ
jgi:biopolymer transport protein ExbD